jgi:hypothetical protein
MGSPFLLTAISPSFLSSSVASARMGVFIALKSQSCLKVTVGVSLPWTNTVDSNTMFPVTHSILFHLNLYNQKRSLRLTALLRPTTPCFAAVYAAMSGYALIPAMEAILTIAPRAGN